MWNCPQHRACVGCGKSGAALGFLFRCTMCEKAHCEDCRGGDQQVIICWGLEIKVIRHHSIPTIYMLCIATLHIGECNV